MATSNFGPYDQTLPVLTPQTQQGMMDLNGRPMATMATPANSEQGWLESFRIPSSWLHEYDPVYGDEQQFGYESGDGGGGPTATRRPQLFAGGTGIANSESAAALQAAIPEQYRTKFEAFQPGGFQTTGGGDSENYETKFGAPSQMVDANGTMWLTVQDPGKHKYDLLRVPFRKDAATGDWVRSGAPQQHRQTSSGEVFRDNLEQDAETAGKMVAAAAALYGAGYGLSAAIGGSGAAGGGAATAGGGGSAAASAAADPLAAYMTTGAVEGSTLGGAAVGGGGAGAVGAGSQAAGMAGTGAAGATAGGGTAGTTAGGGSGSVLGDWGGWNLDTGALMGSAGSGSMNASDWVNLGTTLYGIANQPDTPDTSGINEQARSSAQLARDSFDWFRQEYERTRPQRDAAAERDGKIADAQLSGMNFATDEARRVSGRNQSVFEPLENKLVADSQTFDTPERRAQAAAEATADVESAVGRAQQANQRALMRSGVTLDSPAALALQQDAALGKARMVAGATGAATRNVEQQGYARRMDAAALGRGLPSNQATQQQIATNSGSAAVNSGAGAIGAAQAGVPIMQAGFNTAQQGLNSAGSLFGQAGQLTSTTRGQDLNFLGNAFNGYMRSSKKVKKDTGQVTDGKEELAQVMSTPVHEGWRYDPSKGGPPDNGPHTGPMAEDVHAKMGPSVAPGGEMIDVKRLTGTLMAAVQAVASDVAELRDQLGERAKMTSKRPAAAQEA